MERGRERKGRQKEREICRERGRERRGERGGEREGETVSSYDYMDIVRTIFLPMYTGWCEHTGKDAYINKIYSNNSQNKFIQIM